jgi:hypothetical protein
MEQNINQNLNQNQNPDQNQDQNQQINDNLNQNNTDNANLTIQQAEIPQQALSQSKPVTQIKKEFYVILKWRDFLAATEDLMNQKIIPQQSQSLSIFFQGLSSVALNKPVRDRLCNFLFYFILFLILFFCFFVFS